MAAKPYIKGLTTNPTLMRKAGVTDYKLFALDVLREIKDKPISLEVFSDDFDAMERRGIFHLSDQPVAARKTLPIARRPIGAWAGHHSLHG